MCGNTENTGEGQGRGKDHSGIEKEGELKGKESAMACMKR